jgi:hypothetical protein
MREREREREMGEIQKILMQDETQQSFPEIMWYKDVCE